MRRIGVRIAVPTALVHSRLRQSLLTLSDENVVNMHNAQVCFQYYPMRKPLVGGCSYWDFSRHVEVRFSRISSGVDYKELENTLHDNTLHITSALVDAFQCDSLRGAFLHMKHWQQVTRLLRLLNMRVLLTIEWKDKLYQCTADLSDEWDTKFRHHSRTFPLVPSPDLKTAIEDTVQWLFEFTSEKNTSLLAEQRKEESLRMARGVLDLVVRSTRLPYHVSERIGRAGEKDRDCLAVSVTFVKPTIDMSQQDTPMAEKAPAKEEATRWAEVTILDTCASLRQMGVEHAVYDKEKDTLLCYDKEKLLKLSFYPLGSMKGIRNLVNFCLERPVYSTVQVNPKDWKDTLTVMIRQSFGEQPARLKSSTAAGFFSGVFLPAPLTETKFLVKLNSGQERHFFLSELLALFRETCATPDEWPVVPFRPSFFDSWPVTRQKIEQLWKEGYELNSTENGACTLKVDGEHVRQVVRLPADGSIFNSFYRELDRNGDADRETVKQCALEEIRHGTNLSYVKCLGYYFHGIQTQYQRVDGKRLLSARITPSLFATLAVVESSDGDQTKEYLAKLFLEKQFPQLSRLILLLHEVKRLLIELHSLGKECVLVFKDTSVRVVDAENHSVGEFSWDDPIQTTPHIIRVLNDMKQDSIQTLHTDSFRVDAALMTSLLQQHKQFKRLYPSYDHRSQELALQGIDAETSRPITLKKVVVQSWDSVPVKLLSLYRELLPSLQKAVPPVGEDVVVHKAHLDKLFARPFTVSNYQSSTGWVAEVSVSSSILGFRGERPFTFRKRESVKNKANRHLLRALYVLFVVPVLQVRADFFQRIPEKKPTVSPKMLSGPEVGSVATVVGDLTQARSFLDFVSTSVKEQVLSLYGKSGTVALKLNNTLGFSLLYRPAAPRAVAKPSARRVKVKGGECVVLTTDVWSTNIWAPFHILLAVLQVLYKMGADELDVTLQDRWSKAIKEVTSVPNEAFVRLFFLSVFGWRTHAADGDMPPKESIYLKQHAVLLKHGLYQSTLSLVQYEEGSKTFERILCIGFGDDDGQSANSLYTNATHEILTFFNVKKGEEISWAQLARQAEGVI